MQKAKSKSDPWPDCANIKLPTLTEAAIQFNARAMPALIPSTNIVTCSTTGEDSQGAKSERGDRVGKHMTYQLKDEMEEWEDDQDKLLIMLPIGGCVFKKTFQSPELNRPVSKLVRPTNLIIKYDSPSIERAPRISEEIEFYPREIQAKQRAGEWIDHDIQCKDEDKQELETFVTQHTYIDPFNYGFKVPYIVTIHKDSQKVMRIQANYTERGIFYLDGTEILSVGKTKEKIESINNQIEAANIEADALQQNAGGQITETVKQNPQPNPDFSKYKVTRIDATKYYTKYTFIPSPDGNIYDLGLGQLLAPLLDAGDSLINQMLDAGTLANKQGGFIAEGVKTQAGIARVNVSEFTKVKTQGMSLKESIVPFNFRGPSATAFSLLAFLVDSAKAIANLKDILSGEAPQGETATTSMIKREEGMRVYNSIYKRIYRAFKKELGLIYNLNAMYLPDDVYFNVLDTQEAIKKKDYSFDKTDVRPTADPSESSQSQKIMKAEAGLQFAADPSFNGYELRRRYLEALEIPNIDEILPPPSEDNNKPDPLLVKTIAEVQEIEAKTQKTHKEIEKMHSEIIKNLAEAEAKEIGPQMEIYKKQAEAIMKKGEINARRAEGINGGVETPSANQGNEAILPESAGGIEQTREPGAMGGEII